MPKKPHALAIEWQCIDEGTYVPEDEAIRAEGWRLTGSDSWGWRMHREDEDMGTFAARSHAARRVVQLRAAKKRPLRLAPLSDKDDDDGRFYGGSRE